MVLDAPEHEDDAVDDAEYQRVGKVFVHRELDQVPPQSELSGGGHDGGEHPPSGDVFWSDRKLGDKTNITSKLRRL